MVGQVDEGNQFTFRNANLCPMKMPIREWATAGVIFVLVLSNYHYKRIKAEVVNIKTSRHVYIFDNYGD